MKKAAAETNGPAGAGTNGTSVPKAPKKAVASAGVDDAAALARGMKKLVAQYGAAAVKNMTDVFAE